MTHSSTPNSSTQSIDYETDPDTGAVLIPLGGKKYPGLFALVDPDDAENVSGYRWSAFCPASKGDRRILYAKTTTPERTWPYMHRLILGLTDPKVKVDHINHNGLDNRRCNLRIGTHQQNIYNRRGNLHSTSQYKGVHWRSQVGKWQVRIKHNGRMIDLGRFDDEREAAEVYDGAALMLFGSYAHLNFPGDTEGEVA